MGGNIKLIQGDITRQGTEAIVNAANSSLMGGGGVDGAIHRAGGPEILRQCKDIVARQGRLSTGEAVVTTAGNMKAKYVIHTVGPVWHGGDLNEEQLLRNAYHNSLRVAVENNLRSISFPSISTGAYRFPIDRAAVIALKTVNEFFGQLARKEPGKSIDVWFVLFSKEDLGRYETAYREVFSDNARE